MEIQVNGETVEEIDGFIRNVSVRLDDGEVTNFDVSPQNLVVNVIVTPKLDANAPRLDELEALHRLEHQERTANDPEDTVDAETVREATEENSSPFTIGGNE